MIKYYFIVIVIIATALTIWDKTTKSKNKDGAFAPPEKDKEKPEDKPL